MKVLHIVNGDVTADLLKKGGVEGDVAVWREMLCEGPTVFPVGDDSFWDIRSKHFADTYGITDYEPHFRPQFDLIAEHAKYAETVLWFEYDLFCQINMLAVLHYLNATQKPGEKISLVCVGKQNDSDEMLGLGEIEPKEFKALMFLRTQLVSETLAYAAKAWEAYCADDITKLLPFIYQASNSNFEYLPSALSVHLKRFPSTANGLNDIEQTMLQLIDKGQLTDGQLVRELLQWQTWYGFGDMQYFHYLKELSELIEKDGEQLKLTALGQEVLAGKEQIIKPETRYGGATKQDYRLDPEFGIVKVD